MHLFFEKIDNFLNRISMYRLVLYSLVFFIFIASILGLLKIVPFSPMEILFSGLILVSVCWIANRVISKLFKFPTNTESTFITALILTLIMNPAHDLQGYLMLFGVGFLATVSKYIFVLNKRHIFNPAASGAFLIFLLFNESASWWVGNFWTAPVVFIFGLLIVRKLQLEKLVGSYLITSTVFFTIFLFVSGQNIVNGYSQLFLNSSFLFFAFIMLTEPSTLPPTKRLRVFYAVLIGILTLPQIHIGNFYLTPESALLVGNIFSFVVGPRQNLILKLSEKKNIAKDIFEFSFSPNKKYNYSPGQYMEWTLQHKNTDSRGNRRYFTLASSPTEENIEIGVRFNDKGSSFKKSLFDFDDNSLIKAGSLGGDFTLPSDKNRKLVFVAGGIGITPFRSMIKYLLDKQEKRDIVLLYSNTSENEIAYRDIFDQAGVLGIKVVYFLTGESVSSTWIGRTGRINKDAVPLEVSDYKERLFYISGSLQLVNGVKQSLRNLGIRRNQIKTDFFPGYV